MTEPPAPAALRRWALAGSALTFVLIVIGGVVRITGSGMGCGDHWPLCNGEWFPPLDLPTFIEIFHRWVAALVSVAVAGTVFVAWRRHRGDRRLLVPAVLGAALLVVQVLLGAVTVKLELPPRVVIVHLLNAMLVMGAVLWTALETGPLGRAGAVPDGRKGPRRAALGFAAFGLVVVLWGAQVANLHAGFVCRGFPLCQGAGLGPPDTPLGPLHWTHRMLAYAFLAVAAAAALRLRGPAIPAPVRRAAQAVLAATLAQVIIAAGMVLLALPAWLRALHLAGGAAVWAALVVLVHRVARTAWPAAPARAAALAEASRSA